MMEMPLPVWPEPKPGESITATYLPPLPEPELTCWYGPSSEFYQEPMFSADQLRAYAESCARMAREEEREKLRALVLDDAWSLTFQTFGQYRSALVAAIKKEK